MNEEASLSSTADRISDSSLSSSGSGLRLASSSASASATVRVFLGKLSELVSSGARRPADTLARVLPRLASADAASAETLASSVAASFAKLRDLDALAPGLPGAAALALELDCAASVADGVSARDDAGAKLRSLMLRRGAVREVTGYLIDVAFAKPGARELDKSSEAWAEALARPALGAALVALRGVVKGHFESARAAAGAERSGESERESRGGADETATATIPTATATTTPAKTTPANAGPSDLLALLHALESVAEGGVGTRAEEALEAIERADADAAETTSKLRAATKAESMRKAMERREKMLAEMGLTRQVSPGAGGSTPPGATPPASPPRFGDAGSFTPGASPRGNDILAVARSPTSMLGVDDISDEEEDERQGAVVCRVCREGYKSRPRDLIGVYAFCKRVDASDASASASASASSAPSSPSRPLPRVFTVGRTPLGGYATVSHFNAIHFACHAAARRADIALRTPKREWEGAALRNSETLANNLLPFRSGRVSDAEHERALDQWWENLASVGRPEAPSARLRIALGDVAMLLGRVAVGASFSVDCNGGGRESNARALPALAQLACAEYVRAEREAEARGTPPRDDDARTALAALRRGDAAAAAETGAGFLAGMVLSVFELSRNEWRGVRRCALVAAATHAAREGVAALGAARSPAEAEAARDAEAAREAGEDRAGGAGTMRTFERARPAFVFVGLVDKLHEGLKPEGGPGGEETARAAAGRGCLRAAASEPVAVGGREDSGGEGSGGGSGEEGDDGEEGVVGAPARAASRELRKLPETKRLAEEMLEWLEEAEEAADFQELFDIMECLADVLSDGTESADAFVEEAFEEARKRER